MSPAEQAQERREACRRAVLGFLAERQQVAQHAKTICRRLNDGHENDYADAEVEGALAFLAGTEPPLVKAIPDPMGATRYYQATAAGVLAHERRA